MVAVFVSYAREDSEFAQRFCVGLDRPGIEPWLDQDRLKPGRWEPALTDALGRSRYVLPLLSRHSLDPDEPGYVQTEWDIALSADKLVVPILVEAIPERLRSSPWFKRMSDYEWYDLAVDYDANLRKLMRALVGDDAGDLFRETFSCDGPDREGWDLGDWSLSEEDATGRRSQSLHAKVSLAAFGKPAPPSEASIAVDLGAWDSLEYTRRLALRSANIASRASFQVVVDDGAEHVLDERTQDGLGEHTETRWTVRRVDVGGFSGRRIRLKFVLTAADPWSITTSAEAWVDNIRISRAAMSADGSC